MTHEKLIIPLQQLWADNFLVYFKAHSFHFNVQGETFGQDHALFQEIYDYLWGQHDVLGEQIRQMDKPVLTSLKLVMAASSIKEATPKQKEAKEMLDEISNDISCLLDCTQALYDKAEECCCAGLSTILGDYSSALSKLNWKCKASIGRSIK